MLLRVVRGRPDPDELAALLTVVAGRAAGPGESAGPGRASGWAAPARRLAAPVPTPAPAAWRRSLLPR